MLRLRSGLRAPLYPAQTGRLSLADQWNSVSWKALDSFSLSGEMGNLITFLHHDFPRNLKIASESLDALSILGYSVKHIPLSIHVLTSRWVQHSIRLGHHPVGFDISIMGYLFNPGEFIALDDIELVDCDPEPRQRDQCPDDRPFTCMDTWSCLPLDRVCDQHADCLCENDEWEETCGEYG
ncbi:hypothetical protein PoB_000885900 [Plakobranchus ocellatus]|uniref:Uncharacterized protein n=1 Tax=Plakobranchus ocellatus TaxID=259542 RepID=A0AAV3YJ98_9GAST|nr:hypothetical protein PoB_000885900 [Plakobranchus ocellatus]